MGGGSVDTSGTPVANDIARFTDVNTIEGLTYQELIDLLVTLDWDLTGASSVDLGPINAGEGVVELPNSAAPTTDATGEIALDTTITDHHSNRHSRTPCT